MLLLWIFMLLQLLFLPEVLRLLRGFVCWEEG
jgi:hypothetical protein